VFTYIVYFGLYLVGYYDVIFKLSNFINTIINQIEFILVFAQVTFNESSPIAIKTVNIIQN
jgi:hypothetical protein